MSPEQELQRAREAARLLEDPLFKAAKDDVYGQLSAARRAALTTNPAQCADLVRFEQIADKFFGYFQQIAQTGQFAQLHLNELEQRRKGLAERLRSYATFGRNGL